MKYTYVLPTTLNFVSYVNDEVVNARRRGLVPNLTLPNMMERSRLLIDQSLPLVVSTEIKNA